MSPERDKNGQESAAQGQGRHAALHGWLDSAPSSDLPELLRTLHRARENFQSEMAEQVTPGLNAYLSRQPQVTYEQKKQLSQWLNRQLRELDLAIEDPVTKMPAVLTVGNRSEGGLFYLKVTLPDGKHSSNLISALTNMHFTARDVGVDKSTLWQERTAGVRQARER